MPQPKFKINDQVMTGRIGVPAHGAVKAVWEGQAHCGYYNAMDVYGWDRYYEDWREGYLYLLFFREPIKVVSLDEYMDIMNKGLQMVTGSGIGENEKKQFIRSYNYDLKPERYIWYPEIDLELMEN